MAGIPIPPQLPVIPIGRSLVVLPGTLSRITVETAAATALMDRLADKFSQKEPVLVGLVPSMPSAADDVSTPCVVSLLVMRVAIGRRRGAGRRICLAAGCARQWRG